MDRTTVHSGESEWPNCHRGMNHGEDMVGKIEKLYGQVGRLVRE